jgi:UrcA family protein
MKTTAKNQHVFAAFATVCLAGIAIGAHADETINGAAVVTVRYADLNLGTQAGVNRLYDRIRHAAEQICGDVGEQQLERAAAAKVCVKQAILGGVQAVNNPMLTKEFDADFGIAKPIDVAALE